MLIYHVHFGARPLLALLGDENPRVRTAAAADLGCTLALVAPPAGSGSGAGSGQGPGGAGAEWAAALAALEAGVARDWRLHLSIIHALPQVLQVCRGPPLSDNF